MVQRVLTVLVPTVLRVHFSTIAPFAPSALAPSALAPLAATGTLSTDSTFSTSTFSTHQHP